MQSTTAGSLQFSCNAGHCSNNKLHSYSKIEIRTVSNLTTHGYPGFKSKNEKLVILENQSEQVFWMDELILLTFEFSKF